MLQLVLLLTVAMTSACPVLDSRCSCSYVDQPHSNRLQFISCLNMGLIQQVPAFDVSYAETERLTIGLNTTVVRLQSQAFAYVKARHLTLRGLSVTVVDHLVFSGLEQITISIDLGDNNISHLPYDTFFRLSRLTTIKLDANRIATLDHSTFRFMSQLSHLNLANNLLQQLPTSILRDTINLQTLRLHGNRITTISQNMLANLRNLEMLDLSDNRLAAISPDAFASQTNLRRLSLSGNMITGTLTSSLLRQLGKLIKLNLSRNYVSALTSNAFQGCRQLTLVDLSSNRLTRIQPGTFNATTALERVNLSANVIQSVPDDLFGANNSVAVLDLSNSVLTGIGRFLYKVLHLRRLDLSKNFTTEMRSSSFTNSPNLVYLDVRDNRLQGPWNGRLLLRLEELKIDGNNITQLEVENSAVSLTRLTLSSNTITSLPRLFHAPALKLLDTSDNNISRVTDTNFACCRNLHQLRLASNRINSISDGAFRGLSVLTELDLADNRLSSLSAKLFASCIALSVVNLSRNLLTAIDVVTFVGPASLRELDLSWNRLTTLTINLMREVLVTLERLSVSANPLHCDCGLTWLATYTVLVDRNTTICCARHDVRPAVCHYVICRTRAICPATATNSTPSDSTDYVSSLCSQSVSSSLIAAVFQHHWLKTTSVFGEMTTSVLADDNVLPSLTTSVENSSTTSIQCRTAWSSANNANYVIVIAVVVFILNVYMCIYRFSSLLWFLYL